MAIPKLEATLAKYGLIGVMALRKDVEKVSASGKTAESIRFEIEIEDNGNMRFKLLGRKYFSTLETGRGPRRSSQYGEFDLNMLEYMKARGIGADLSEKKRNQLARVLAYKINKEGDSVFKQGGRVVYSETLTKFISELKRAITQDFKKIAINLVVSKANGT
jgi:hypothetical protein